jgi:D-xylulose reductase
MDMEQGALVEPVACAVQMTKVGNVRANQTIVVFGCGPIGVLCQKVSKAYGAKKVIGVDISRGRLDFAKSYGAADGTFLPPKKPADGGSDMEWNEKLAKLIKEEFDLGEGPDVVIEATGAPSCIATGIFLTKKGGTYVQAGMGKEVAFAKPKFSDWCVLTYDLDCGFSNHDCVYPRPYDPRLHSLHNGMLPHGC